MNCERGVIQFILGAIILLGLIVAVVVVGVVGLDELYVSKSGKSLFVQDAKIHEVGSKLRNATEEIRAKREAVASSSASEVSSSPKQGQAKSVNSEDRLVQLQQRLDAGTESETVEK